MACQTFNACTSMNYEMFLYEHVMMLITVPSILVY